MSLVSEALGVSQKTRVESCEAMRGSLHYNYFVGLECLGNGQIQRRGSLTASDIEAGPHSSTKEACSIQRELVVICPRLSALSRVGGTGLGALSSE